MWALAVVTPNSWVQTMAVKRTTAITAIPAVMEDRFTTLTSFLGCLCLDEMSLTREPLMKLNKKHKHKKKAKPPRGFA